MKSVDQAVSELKKIYVTSRPYYVSDFFKDDGNKNLYEFLSSVYRTRYPSNFRILIAQDCVDTYDYQDLPGKFLSTLQKYIDQLGISSCFILIITANSNIEQELKQFRGGTDIQTYVIENKDEYEIVYKKQDTFCVLPWMHLYVGTDGNILPCCVGNQDYPLGNIEENSLEQIAKSSAYNQLRSNMLAGRRSKECSYCYDKEDSNLQSPRQSHNKNWANVRSLDQNSTGEIDEYKPTYLDIRLSNICNLKCRMCSGYFSSAIAQENNELFGNKKNLDSSLRLAQRKLAFEEILKYLPYCEKIYFAGGEPLLSMEHYEILKSLIACNNTNLEIVYNTNFTTLSYQQQSVLDLWSKFSNITIGASLDAHGPVAEYVRHGTVWSTIENNLELVKLHCPHVKISITSIVGLLNATSLMHLQKSWHVSNKLNIKHFSLQIMISPAWMTLTVLPDWHKERLEKEIKSHVSWCETHHADELAKQWNDVLNYMWSQSDSHQLKEFKRLTHILDNHRKTSLVSVLPEYQDLI